MIQIEVDGKAPPASCGFSGKFHNELESRQSHVGPQFNIKHYPKKVFLLACEDTEILADIDTPTDLKPVDLTPPFSLSFQPLV